MHVSGITPPSILTNATGFMSSYDYTLNPYVGCGFGCTYCYAQFFNHSEKTWGDWVQIKENAITNMRTMARKVDGKTIYMSSVTDPYQPQERKANITRGILQVLANSMSKPKLVIQTRSPDVVRDAHLLQEITNHGGKVQVNMTITTDDEQTRKAFEPSCPGNNQRIQAVQELVLAGIQTCITMTPLLFVRDAQQFGQDLLNTGCKRFIIQPFHAKASSGQTMKAATGEEAMKLMNQMGETSYEENYRQTLKVLQGILPHLGQGKEGFAPPF